MIGNSEKIVGLADTNGLTGIGGDLLAAGKTVGIARHQASTTSSRITREACVHMDVAEKNFCRKVLVGIGRIGLAFGFGGGTFRSSDRTHAGSAKIDHTNYEDIDSPHHLLLNKYYFL